MNRRAVLAAAAAVAVAVAAYALLPQDPAATQDHAVAVPVEDPALVLEAASVNNEFAVDFYNQVSGGDGNIFFSPLSMYVAFSALYEGARGETAEQIRQAFGLSSDADTRRAEIGGMVDHISRPDPYSTLAMANALWADDDLHMLDTYKDTVRGSYGMHVENLDLLEDGIERVNGWIEENTNGTIRDVLKERDITYLARFVITNAIYLDAEWGTQFPKEDTRDAYFWKNSREHTRAEIMSVYGTFDHASLDGFQIVRLPYKGERLSMLVLLPDGRDGIAGLEESLSAPNIDAWRNDMAPTAMGVQIPRFETHSRYNLVDDLKGLGVVDVFTSSLSDLSGIGWDAVTGNGLYVSPAIHRGFVDVHEEGTEAAATTVIVGVTTSQSMLHQFRSDHPFIFMIQDDETRALLFMGRAADPTAG